MKRVSLLLEAVIILTAFVGFCYVLWVVIDGHEVRATKRFDAISVNLVREMGDKPPPTPIPIHTPHMGQQVTQRVGPPMNMKKEDWEKLVERALHDPH